MPVAEPPRKPLRVVEEMAPETTLKVDFDRPPRPRMRSSDDLAAVARANLHEEQQRALLADKQRLEAALEDARQKQLATEAEFRRRLQPEPQLNAFPPPVSTRSQAAPHSVAPGPDDTGFRIRNAKVFGALVVTILTAVGGLVIGIVNAFEPDPAPVVVDNSKQVTEQAGQIAELRRNIARLEQHANDQGAYMAAVLAEACIVLERPPNSPALPSLQVRHQGKKPAKCPSIRVDGPPQPTLSTTRVDNR